MSVGRPIAASRMAPRAKAAPFSILPNGAMVASLPANLVTAPNSGVSLIMDMV